MRYALRVSDPGGRAEHAESQPFQVDLRGVVDLLSRHIYSSPRVYLRELLQNGRDAITARSLRDGHDSSWGVRISPAGVDGTSLVFEDDGIGLTATEVADLLSTVGRSSKRDILDLPRQDYLGQFGIGLLSCFMVADTIVVRSRSVTGGPPIEWCGRSDGTFTVTELDEDLPFGTSVMLEPRPGSEAFVDARAVEQLAREYGRFLPLRVEVMTTAGRPLLITEEPVFLDPGSSEINRYGRELIGAEPFASFPIGCAATGTRGVAFVLPHSPPPGAAQANRVYLGRMLLSERAEVLPSWAFFVRAVINTDGLHPTASREDLVDDDALEETRAALGADVRAWVMRTGAEQPYLLAAFVAAHHLALKALLLHDVELAQIITRWLTVETTLGTVSIERLVRDHAHVRYTETLDEFRHVAGIDAGGPPIVNGGYTYDADVVRMLPRLYTGVTVEKVDVLGEVDALAPPPLDDRAAALAVERRVTAALAEVEVVGVVRALPTGDVAAIYVADPEVLRSADRRRSAGTASPLWSAIVARADDYLSGAALPVGDTHARARLCLNWTSPLVRSLAAVQDDAVFARTVHLLYIQALLAGHNPLGAAERRLMTQAMSDILALSVGLGDVDLVPFNE